MTPESEGLNLPEGLQLEEKLPGGRVAVVYRAHYQGETVALKVYSEKAANWFKNKLNKNIAVHEMAQNRRFRKSPQLLPYTAKPIRVLGQDGQYTLCFLQEFIEGQRVEELGRSQGGLPESLLTMGQKIAQICEIEGLEGLDEFMQNTLVREKAGQWYPVLHDFKHLPGEAGRKKTGSLLARLGFGRNESNEAAFVRQWRQMSARFEKAAG